MAIVSARPVPIAPFEVRNDVLPNLARPVVEFDRGRVQGAAESDFAALRPGQPAFENGTDPRESAGGQHCRRHHGLDEALCGMIERRDLQILARTEMGEETVSTGRSGLPAS